MPTTPTNTVTINVTDQASLRSAIEAAGAYSNTNVVLNFAANSIVYLTSDLPFLNMQAGSLLTIQGNNSIIEGEGTYRGLVAYQGAVAIDNLYFYDTVAKGGAGGSVASDNGSAGGAGGGGAGLGGGLFVASGAAVTIDNVYFKNTAAVGGAGGSITGGSDGGGGGGGGGMGGNGGSANDGTSGGGGGGGIGVGANGSTDWYTTRDGAAGSAFGLSGGGGGGWTYHTNHYVVTSTTDYSHGGAGGLFGGAGGDGYSIGGGGGGIGGQSPPMYYTGSSGFSLSLNWSPAGLAIDLLTIADFINPGTALLATVVLGLYGAIGGQLGAPGFLNQADFTLDGDGFHRDPNGSNIPGLGKIISKLTEGQIKYLFGFGVHVDYTQNGPQGGLPAGGDGGFGGGGGGGGGSQGGWGGFGGGGGGSGNGAYAGFGGAGGFGGGGGGYVASGKYTGPGAPGFGAGATTGKDGGGGLGAGGAIFVQDGGSLTYAGSGSMTGEGAQAGAAGGSDAKAGSGFGQGVFLQGGSTLNLAPGAGQTITVGGIADQAGSDPSYAPAPGAPPASGASLGGAVEGSVVVAGPGEVNLTGVNTYLGGTTLQAGEILLSSGASLEGPVTIQGGDFEAAAGSSLAGVSTVTLTGGQMNVAAHVSMSGLTGLTLAGGQLTLGANVSISAPVYEEGGALSLGAGDALSGDIHVQNDTAAVITVTMGAGATFTGGVYGLGSNQYMRFTQDLGGNGILDKEASTYADNSLYLNYTALHGASFVYGVETRANGAWVTDVHALNPGSSQQTFTINDDQQLTDLLQWVAINDYYYNGVFTINLTPGATVNGAGPSYLVGALGSGTVIDASGQLADGGGADPITNATIAGGNVLLQDSSVTLEAASGQTLTVSSNIIQAYGNGNGPDGLTIGSGGATGKVVLSGVNTFNGGLNFAGGTLELANVQAGGNGGIGFNGGTTLIIDGALAPQNGLYGFAYGDTIDMAGVSLPSGILLLNAAGRLVLNPTTGLGLNFGGLPTGFAFTLAADGHGGTAITALQQPQAPASTAQFVSELGSLGIDTYISLSGISNAVPLSLSQAALTLSPPSGGVVIIDGGAAGQTIDATGLTQGFSISQGAAILENLNMGLFGYGTTPISVGAGARIDLQSMSLPGQLNVAAGGVLAAESGTMIGAVNAAGTFAAAPGAGGLVTLYGAITGDLAVGDVGGTFPEGPVLTGGRVLAQAGSTVSGTVYLDTDTTLELNSTVLGGAPIVFNSPEGARLRLPNALPYNLISYAVAAGQIDVIGASITGSHLLTVQAGKLLNVPNASGSLHFGAGVTVGETFLATSDGAGGTLLTPTVESSTVSSELQFDALGAYIAALPSGGAPNGQNLQYSAGVSGIITIAGPGEAIAPPAGVSLSLSDGGQAGGFVLDNGVSFSLVGTNSFSGGVVLDSGTTLTATSAASLGTGALNINGTSVSLTVGGSAPISNIINGFSSSDTLSLSGVTALQSGYGYTNASGVVTFATASGSYTLTFGGLPIDTPISVQSHGAAGTVITVVGRQTLTVATEAQLDAALTSADAFQGQTIINLANGATISLTTVLPGIKLGANQSLVIHGDGATINGQGAQGGFYVAAGQVAIDNISLVNLLAQGGDGAWAGYAGGGGAGLGGALFVGSAATVNLTGVNFSGDKAVGGAGGSGLGYNNAGGGGAVDANTAAAGAMAGGGSGNGGTGATGGFGGGGGGGGAYENTSVGGFGGGGGDWVGDGGGGAGLGGPSSSSRADRWSSAGRSARAGIRRSAAPDGWSRPASSTGAPARASARGSSARVTPR